MRDPMDELEHFTTPGLTMNPLPAAEVRRRGTRMRRRNNALAAVGGIAAVAIIATPLALAASNNRTDTTPPPAGPGPSVTWVTQIPADFPLTTGLPKTNAHDGSPVEAHDGFEQQVPAICDGAEWDATGAADVSQATYTAEEGGTDRALALYPSESAAAAELATLTAKVQECATQTAGAKQRWTEVLPSQIGDRSLVYVNHYTDGGDIDVLQVVRVGNAILQDTIYSGGGGDPAVVQHAANLLQEKSASVVDAMCVFSADPC